MTLSSPLPQGEDLRIAHTLSSIENKSAGPSHSVPGLAYAQAALGATVSLHSLGGQPEHAAAGLQDHRYRRDFATVPGLRRMGLSRQMQQAIRGGRHESDVIHTHGLWLMANGWFAPQTPFVISPRGMLSEVALGFSPMRKRLMRWISQDAAFAAAGMFHATAEIERSDIRAYGLRQPVAIIPNGIDLPELQPAPDAGTPRRVVTLGRVHPKKGLDLLLGAWSRVEAAHPGWQLEIIGPDQAGHRAELEALAAQLGLKRVTFFGPKYGADKLLAMGQADLFILPSRSENFAMTVAESLALAVPVIATRGTPWPGLVEKDCGWWVESTAEALGGALSQALALPPEVRAGMGARGRVWMKDEFSWARIAQMSIEAYRWLLKRGDQPDFVHLD
ncbi:glycosyltransferase [Pararhodobacter zhoushanensis]|uniref:glycosyltransferase n=1 Tax=Pararhodobacter zhoushanensis TaxID=2479545 RepID=UPI0013DEDB65|nr:glycosyltransferase [Pararhodobacter zhoushanensis]